MSIKGSFLVQTNKLQLISVVIFVQFFDHSPNRYEPNIYSSVTPLLCTQMRQYHNAFYSVLHCIHVAINSQIFIKLFHNHFNSVPNSFICPHIM